MKNNNAYTKNNERTEVMAVVQRVMKKIGRGARTTSPGSQAVRATLLTAVAAIAIVLAMAGPLWADTELLVNTNFTAGLANWSVGTCTGVGCTAGEGTTDNDADGSKSVRHYVTNAGKNIISAVEVSQTFGATIPAGSSIVTASAYVSLASSTENTGDNVQFEILYNDATRGAVFNSGEIASSGFTQKSGGAGFQLQKIGTGLIITMNVKTGATNGSTVEMVMDTVSLVYNPYACPAVAPNDLNLTGRTSSSVSMSWSFDTTNNHSYNVYRDGGSIATGVTAVPYTNNTGLTQKTKYTYKVRGYNSNFSGCESGDSNSLIAQTRSTNKFQTDFCGYCHAAPPDDSFTQVRNTPEGATVGRHANPYHVSPSNDENECKKCHAVPSITDYGHRDGVIDMNTTNIAGQTGSYYDKDKDNVKEAAPIDTGFDHTKDVSLATLGRCVATYCHGSRTYSKVWGTNTGVAQCNICHTMSAAAQIDTEGHTATNDAQAGKHMSHLGSAHNISADILCADCHTVPVLHTDAGHNDSASPAEITFSAKAKTGSAPAAYASGTCQNVYCHDGYYFKNKWSTGTYDVSWTNTTYYSTTPATWCSRCHGYPPPSPHDAGTDCSGCHPHVNAADTGFDTPVNQALHVNGTIEKSVACTGCHNGIPTGSGTQYVTRNVATDFTSTSRHVFGGTVGSWDCIVCHMEGNETNAASGNPDTSNTYHETSGTKDVEMRNVDSPTTGWVWIKTAITEAMRTNMDTFCMNCHDSNGASAIAVSSSNDRVDLNANVSTTEALAPFNSTDDLDDAGTPGGSAGPIDRTRVVDVKTQFATTNPSHHAVLGQRYSTTNAGLANSWVTRTLKNGSALMTVKETARLHCSDCHNTETNAHSGANRYMMAAATVDDTCWLCHRSTVYSAGAAAGSRWAHSADSSRTFNTGNGSKIDTVGAGSTGSQCLNCHGGGTSAAGSEDDYGRIHGNSGTDYRDSQTKYRFIGGSYMAGYSGNWTNSGTNVTCYFDAASGVTMSLCGQHGGSKTGGGNTLFTRGTTY